jgi:hypothetical protein
MFSFDEEQFRKIIREEISKATSQQKDESLQLLDTSDLMSIFKVGRNKVSELWSRQDFPVNRELGHPRVAKHLLIKWIDSHSEWVDENTDYLKEAM